MAWARWDPPQLARIPYDPVSTSCREKSSPKIPEQARENENIPVKSRESIERQQAVLPVSQLAPRNKPCLGELTSNRVAVRYTGRARACNNTM